MGLDIYFTKKKTSNIGYFRKVNFLVRYFADLGFDVENQVPFSIDKEDVEELLNRCNKVLENHELADELLPTVSGFFFGSTDYDEYYFQNVERVKNYIEGELIPAFEDLDPDEGIYFETWY
jgi:hypothetical protein